MIMPMHMMWTLVMKVYWQDEDTGPGVEVGDVHQGGAEIPVGHLAEAARNVDSINVNGVDLTRDSALNNLRDACGYYKLSTSGSKARCFSRLLEHAKKLELQVILAAARAAEQEALRVPRAGYGARVKLTKNPRETKSASFEVPLGPIQASKLVDEDAEAVRMKAEDEKMEDQELTGMAVNDPLLNKPVQMEATEQKELVEVDEDIEIPTTMPSRTVPPAGMNVFDDPEPPSVAEQARSSAGSVGMRVPVVPIDVPTGVEAASSSSTRGHGDEVQGGSEPKKPRVEFHKKQKINMLIQEHATCVRMVKFGDEVHHTMDDYSTDLVVDSTDLSLYEPYELATTDVDKAVNDDWYQEEEIQFNETPEGVWSDEPLEVIPGQPPAWVDKLADEIEIERLASMKVLERAETYAGSVSDKATLTTKFVYDWRVKMYTPPGGTEVQSRKRWMRRSRFVAREFAAGDKRDDVYSPATSNHTANLLQLVYLEKLSQAELASLGADSQYGVTLASMDIKDAFLQVDQEEPTQVLLHGRSYVLLKNLPGQRLGAKAWYWCLRNFMSSALGCEWCPEQPCLTRTEKGCWMVHVDDLLFVGDTQYWRDTVLPTFQAKFSTSFSELGGTDTEIKFLKRKIIKTEDGLMLVSATDPMKVVETFEKLFGPARAQQIPCDGSIQLEDKSKSLSTMDSSSYRRVVGMLLYLSRDRPDLLFATKELSSKMSSPTLVALQRLRKVIGYIKQMGSVGIKLTVPIPGCGRWKKGSDSVWLLETFSDADWSSNREHRRSTSCSIHYINGNYVYGTARTQKVVSLSSCESELHAIVSGMSDAIFLRCCFAFVSNCPVAHVHFTDSSSARQLVTRQGTGKVRHLSGKVLWVQEKTLNGEVVMAQVPTVWNTGDIGTKALSRQRLMFLLHECGGVQGETGESIGQEEFHAVSEKQMGQQQVRHMAKALLRMTMLMGLEPIGAAGEEICEIGAQSIRVEQTGVGWLEWLLFISCFAILVGCAYGIWKLSRRLAMVENDIWHIQHQMENQDWYSGENRERIYQLETTRLEESSLPIPLTQFYNMVGRLRHDVDVQEQSLETINDTMETFQYGLVEMGGFVRLRELNLDQRMWLHRTERANLVAFSAFGAGEYLRLVSQRGRVFQADDTEQGEGAEEEDEMEVDLSVFPPGPFSVMVEILKDEAARCVAMGHNESARIIQKYVMESIDVINGGINDEKIALWRRKMAQCYATLRGLAGGSGDEENSRRYDRQFGIYSAPG